MNTTYYRRIANPGGNNYIEATFDKAVYNTLASSTSSFNVFKLKESQEQYLEKITVNSSNIDLDNKSYLTTATHTFENYIPAKIYKITKQCLVDKGLTVNDDIVVRIFINEDATDLFGLFANLGTNLKKITFNIDTANVTNMGYMFQGASYLTAIEFKKFNSSKVETFAGMFNNCTSIKNLNLNRVSSNSVQSMFKTFENCSSLETLNISNWNTSNVKDMSYMFNECTHLKNIQIGSNFKVSNVTDMRYMFSDCNDLNTIGTKENTIDLSKFSSSSTSTGCDCSYMFYTAVTTNKNITLKLGSLKVTNCSHMFTKSEFTTINLNIYSSKSIDTSYMFYNDTSTSSFNKLKFVTFSNTTNSLKSKKCSYMFYNCVNIEDISFNLFDTSACTDMQYMFCNCGFLYTLDLSGFNTSACKNMQYMFNSCVSLYTLDISRFDTSVCTNMQYMFFNCASLETLDISGFNTSYVTNFYKMFALCDKLNKITTNIDTFVLDASTNLSEMFYGCTLLKTLGKTDNKVYIKNKNNINSCADISYMFESCTAMTSCQLVNFTSTKLTSVGFMLGNCTSLQTLNIDGLGGENIYSKSQDSVFIFGTKNANNSDVFGAPALINLTINNFNLGSLQRFSAGQDYNGETILSDNILLYNCLNLENCTFTNWTMLNVNSLHVFFVPHKGTPSKLKTVNLTGLRTSENLKTMWSMFSGCTLLTTIEGLNRNSSPNLVISEVNDTHLMFSNCQSLTKIDLSGWDSNKIENSSDMFSNCQKLKEIVNIENFVTSTCTDIQGMFNNCYELVELDLSGWNTSNVTKMQNLFYMDRSCKLELITTSTNFKLNDTVDLLKNIFNKELENKEDCGNENPGLGTYYYPNLGKIIIDEDSGAEAKLANINEPYFSLEIIPGSTNSFKYGKYEYLPNNWQAQIIKRNYILARYDGSLETSISNYRNFINPSQTNGWDIYIYSESRIADKITYDENNNLIKSIDYTVFDTLTADEILSNKTGYKDDGVYWLKICPNNSANSIKLSSLFLNCTNITYVDFSQFKFSYNNIIYTSASHCLESTTNLIQCKMTSNANKVYDTVSMFAGCTSLIKFDANSFTAQNVIDAEKMFSNCTALKDGSQFSDLKFKSLENASYIFNGSGLENINITIESTENIDFYSAFEGCTSLTTATVKFTNAKDISRMFYGCTNLTNAYFNYIKVNTGKTTIPPDFETLNKSNTRGYGLISVFHSCKNLNTIEFKGSTVISAIDTSGYVSCYGMFYGTERLEGLSIHISRYTWSDNEYGILTTNRMFGQSMLNRGSLNNDFRSNSIYCYIESGCLQDTSKMFYQSGITGLILDIKKHINNNSYAKLDIKNMSFMFAECNVLSNIVNNQEHILEGHEKYTNHTFDLSWLETSGTCNCTGMFEGTSSRLYLYSDNTIDETIGEGKIKIENFNKELVKNYDTTPMLIDVILGPIKASDCSNMFYNGRYNEYSDSDIGKLPLYIKSIDFDKFNISQCTSIENMFRGCIFIKELNLESLDLSKVTNMDYAFYNYVHIIQRGGGYSGGYDKNTPLHLPENKDFNDGGNYIINKLSVIRTDTDFNSSVSCNNLFHKSFEGAYVYTYFDGVFYYKQHAENVGRIIPNSDTNPSIYENGEKIYNGNHMYIPNNWMGLPIIESDYFLVYYDASEIKPINKTTIINTNSNNSDNSDIKIFEVPYFGADSLDWGINKDFCIDDLYWFGFTGLDLDKEKFYINSNWKEIDIDEENAVSKNVYIVLRERNDLSYLFEGCTCNLNIIAGPQTIEITSIKGLFKNCIGLGFKHTNSDVEIYGAGNIYTYNLLNNITTDKSDCLEELYAGCSNIISHQNTFYVNEHATEDDLNKLYFLFYPIYGCVWSNKEITSFKNLFNGCSNIRNIEFCANIVSTISNVDTITDVSKMFYDCSKLIQINKPSKDSTNAKTFSNISNFESVFENCEKLESGADTFFDLADLEKPQPIGNAKSMFKNCKKLVFENNESVGSNWNISTSTTDLSNMFYNCFELKGIDMSKWNICNVSDMSGMFYMKEGNVVNLSKVNFVSSDSNLPSSVNIDSLFNKANENANEDLFYHGYIYPSQSEPTTGSFTYVEGNNIKQFLPDNDKNPELTNGKWTRFGDHAFIPDNWNASYIISGDDCYVLMVYRPDYTTTNGVKIQTFDRKTLLMNSDYYSNSGDFRSHINYTAITTDKGGTVNDDLSQLYSVAATSTYDGTAVSFKTIKVYSYEKPIEGSTETTTIYMRNPNLTFDQVLEVENSDYSVEDLSVPFGVDESITNSRVTNTFYVNDSIKNSRIIAKVKFTEYLNTFCYHSDNINAGIFDNGTENNIKLYKIDFSRSRSFWYGNNPELGKDKILNENYENNDFKTYEQNNHVQHIYNRGLNDCYRAFYNCNLLEEIKFKDESGTYASDPWGMFTKTFTNTSYMFYGCSALKSLNIKCFDTKNVDQMKYMFYGCSNLKTLEFTHAQTTNDGYYIGFDTYNNLLFGYMFGECSQLTELNLKGFYFNEDIILYNTPLSFFQIIFNENNPLTTEEQVKTLASSEVNGVHYLTNMFYNCTKLQYLMLPDISRFLYRMFRKYNGDDNKIKYIKILIRSLFNTKIDGEIKPILYCEFDDINYNSYQDLETPEWLFGDQDCTGYSTEDGTILDIMFNMLPNNWTIQPSTNKIFIYIENSVSSSPFYVIKYGYNIKSINIYDSTNFKQINGEFDIYNNPNNSNNVTYKTYYEYYNEQIKSITNDYIYIQKRDSSNVTGLIVEIVFKNYFDNYSTNFDTSCLFALEYSSYSNQFFINTIPSKEDKKNINMSSKFNKIYLHSFGIRTHKTIIPKFNLLDIFYNCTLLTDIFNLDILKYSTNIKNESNSSLKTIISNTSYAFKNCNSITFIDCFNWDTSNVTNMCETFLNCYNLTKIGDEENYLDFSNWITSNVTDMMSTFSGINSSNAEEQKEITLNLTNWNTGKVTDMSYMFKNSYFKEIRGLNKFDTSKVTTLQETFANCNIGNFNDVTDWDVSKVTNMSSMFDYSYTASKYDDYLTTLNLSKWDTSSVTNISNMFSTRRNLTSLDLSDWNTSNVTQMYSMFFGCYLLSEIKDIENFETLKCENMMYMFGSCKSLTELDLSKWNTSKVTNMLSMFNGCESLSDINLSGWNTASVTDMSQMFLGCKALTNNNIDHILSNIEFNKVIDISEMFKDCNSITSITKDFTDIRGDLVDATYLFSKNGNNLTLNNIKNIIENAEYIFHMFSGINKLNIKDFITFDMSHIKSLGNLFYKTKLDSPICFSGNFNMILGSDVMINDKTYSAIYSATDTSVNGIFGYCDHGDNINTINNLSTFDISFGTYYKDEDFENFDLFGYEDIFSGKDYLHYFIPTYKSNDGSLNYDYSYTSTTYFGGLTNIFNNQKQTSILLGDCFKDTLNNSFFKIYGDTTVTNTNKLLICNSENLAKNIQNSYENLNILYKCIVVNLTLDIPSGYTDVIISICNGLLNNPSYSYFDNKTYIRENINSNITGRHIITAIFMFPETSEDINIFNTEFKDQQICDCITHIVISNSIENINTSLPAIEFNNLKEVTIYFLPIDGYVVDYDPGILRSLDGNSNNTVININLIYDIENEDIEIPTKPSNTTYNIKCNPNNDDEKISGYNCYKYIVGDLRNY